MNCSPSDTRSDALLLSSRSRRTLACISGKSYDLFCRFVEAAELDDIRDCTFAFYRDCLVMRFFWKVCFAYIIEEIKQFVQKTFRIYILILS